MAGCRLALNLLPPLTALLGVKVNKTVVTRWAKNINTRVQSAFLIVCLMKSLCLPVSLYIPVSVFHFLSPSLCLSTLGVARLRDFRRADQGQLSLLAHLLTHLPRPSLCPGSCLSPARLLWVPRWPWNKELQSVGPHGAVQGAADRYIISQSYSSLCTPALLN